MFAEYWKKRSDEKSDSQSFWLTFAHVVLNVAEHEKFILFEECVQEDYKVWLNLKRQNYCLK